MSIADYCPCDVPASNYDDDDYHNDHNFFSNHNNNACAPGYDNYEKRVICSQPGTWLQTGCSEPMISEMPMPSRQVNR